MLLKGQVAVITGSGRGVGRSIAMRFAAEGAAVLVCARTDIEIQKVAAEIQKAGGEAAAVVADVSRQEDCEEIVRTAKNRFGGVHILVNNAAILGPVKTAENVAPSEWDEVMAVNLRSVFLMSRLVLPEMYERKSGSILSVVSVAAKIAFPLNSAYAASKAGIIGLTHTLAAEGARKGVRVNAISPGPVTETKMWEQLESKLSEHYQTDRIRSHAIEGVLQGRPQTADEIAAAALFLVSDQGSAITGQTLNVDGGMAFY